MTKDIESLIQAIHNLQAASLNIIEAQEVLVGVVSEHQKMLTDIIQYNKNLEKRLGESLLHWGET